MIDLQADSEKKEKLFLRLRGDFQPARCTAVPLALKSDAHLLDVT